MSYEHIALFLLLVIVIEIIGTIGGFGSSMLFVPFASFFEKSQFGEVAEYMESSG